MGSSHHSRGRILFEILCALAVSASLAGAWVQTGASALLPAAAVALLYALIHLFDLSARPALIAQPVTQSDAQAEPVEAAASQAVPRPQASKKVTSRRTKSPKAKASKPVASETSIVAELAATEELVVPELAPSDEIETVMPPSPEALAHAPVTQLFEPEPFAHQQRTVFGRKAG